MTKPIYAGLSNEQAFALMNAQIELQDELPMLSEWSARSYWRNVLFLVAGLTALVVAIGVAWGVPMVVLGATATAAIVLVGGLAWMNALLTRRRLLYLVALKAGLEQFRAAAERLPGASASELLSMVSDQPVPAK